VNLSRRTSIRNAALLAIVFAIAARRCGDARARMINAPNLLSLSRLLAAPAIVLLMMESRFDWCFAIFVFAGITDALDGWIAKRFDARTDLGAYLDPLADKTLVVSTYLTLGLLGHLPGWLVVLVIFRDVLIIGGAMVAYLMLGSFKSEPMMISKLNTAVQLILVVAVLAHLGIGFGTPLVDRVLAFVAGGTTIASGLAYLWQWGGRLARADSGL
jgi:cardiolipin synthase